MDGALEIVLGALAGIATTLLTAKLAPDSLGRFLFSGQIRETTALQTITELVREAVTGWREATMAYIQLAGAVTDQKIVEGYHFLELRDRLVQQTQRLDEIAGQLSDLLAGRNGR